MNWSPSDSQGRQGIAIANLIVSKFGQIFREQEQNDRGIDAHVELVEPATQSATGEIVALQIKGGPSWLDEKTPTGFVYRGSSEHLEYWLNHRLPVFLVLVDTAQGKGYWQAICEQTVERLSKGWKVVVPFINELDSTFIYAARYRAGIEPAAASYTLLKLEDASQGMTKGYWAKLLVGHPTTRLRLEAVVRRATAEIKKETFHRTESLSERFGCKEADIVRLFIAGELADATHANYLCNSEWVSPALASENRIYRIGGMDLGDGLEVVWNTAYGHTGQFLKSSEIGKQTFLSQVRQIVAETERLISGTFGDGSRCIVDAETVRKAVDAMRQIFLTATEVGLAPVECRDVAARFQDVMDFADNAFMHADPDDQEGKNSAGVEFLLERTLTKYRTNLDRLSYEIEKVT